MYCLDCGNELEEGARACSKCGLTVTEMQERLAIATEVLLYADSVAGNPDQTEKLPPVNERTYRDKDGNPIDPSQPVEPAALKPDSKLDGLPRIGADDPFVTVPMKKVVDEYGNVIAGEDTTPKLYRQTDHTARSSKVLKVIAAIVAAIALVVAGAFGYRWLSEVNAQQEQERAAEQAALDQENARTQAQEESLALYQDLAATYADAGSFHGELAAAYDTLMDTFARKMAVRQPNAQACEDLHARIQAGRDDLVRLGESAGLASDASPYSASYKAQLALYDDLLFRVQVLDECWAASLALSDVTGHTSEVLAPLSQDGGVGTSDSMNRFQAAYDQAAPELYEPETQG